MEDRKITLLKAAFEMLDKITSNNYQGETAYYDEVDCDAYCLMDDIEDELNNEQYSRYPYGTRS